jgi:hypothetical protein
MDMDCPRLSWVFLTPHRTVYSPPPRTCAYSGNLGDIVADALRDVKFTNRISAVTTRRSARASPSRFSGRAVGQHISSCLCPRYHRLWTEVGDSMAVPICAVTRQQSSTRLDTRNRVFTSFVTLHNTYFGGSSRAGSREAVVFWHSAHTLMVATKPFLILGRPRVPHRLRREIGQGRNGRAPLGCFRHFPGSPVAHVKRSKPPTGSGPITA